MRNKKCERCHEEKPLTDFDRAINGVVKRPQIWCVECRQLDPHGAKLARDAHYARQKTPEENRAKHQVYKSRHPERLKYRSDQELIRIASQLAIEAIEQAKAQSKSLKQQGYTKGQIEKVVGFLREWERMFKPDE